MGDRAARIDMGRKEGAAVPLSGGAGSQSNTMWPEPRSISVPSGVLISTHPFGHNRHGPKTVDCCAPPLVARAEAYLRTKWQLDPSSRGLQ